MADSDTNPPDPPKPSTKTSTVPLKKETVRITLRARPEETGPVAPKGSTAPIPAKGGTAPAPPPAPSAPAAPTPPPAPPAPATPPPGAPQPPGAKTIPLAKAPAPAPGGGGVPVGAKTIPLAKAPKPGGIPAVGKQTTPLGKPGAARPLPQATVKLQQTQPMTKGAETPISSAPNIRSTAVDDDEDWEEEYEESGLVAFSVVVLILALAVLGVTLYTYTLASA